MAAGEVLRQFGGIACVGFVARHGVLGGALNPLHDASYALAEVG